MCSNILRDADSRLSSAILTVSVGFAVVELRWKLRMSRREYSLVRLSFTAGDDSIALFLARSDWELGGLFYNDQLCQLCLDSIDVEYGVAGTSLYCCATLMGLRLDANLTGIGLHS